MKEKETTKPKKLKFEGKWNNYFVNSFINLKNYLYILVFKENVFTKILMAQHFCNPNSKYSKWYKFSIMIHFLYEDVRYSFLSGKITIFIDRCKNTRICWKIHCSNIKHASIIISKHFSKVFRWSSHSLQFNLPTWFSYSNKNWAIINFLIIQ